MEATLKGITGLNNAGRSKQWIRRVIWMVIFLGGLAGTLHSTYVVVQDMLDYPVDTTVTITTQESIDFPSVTVCNQNRIDCSKLASTIQACADITSVSCPLLSETSMVTVTKLLTYCPSDPNSTRRKRQSGPPSIDDLGDVPSTVDTENEFVKTFTGLQDEERQSIGHEFGNTIKGCTFKQRDCLKSSNFYVTNTPSYGNCFTFNSAINDQDTYGGERVSSMAGPNFGLDLVINIEQSKYMGEGVTESAGAQVVVQSSSAHPQPDEMGSQLHPNTNTALAMHERTVTRYEDPYSSNCTSDWTLSNLTGLVPNTTTFPYNLLQCHRFCLFDHFMTQCRCFHPTYLDSDNNRNGLSPCDLRSNGTDAECVNAVIEEMDAGQRSCTCNVECEELNYELSITQSAWPAKQYEKMAMAAYGFTSGDSGDTSLSRNLLKIQVYFTSLNVETIAESPTYQWDDGSYISAMGGAISLYLGISIAMVFEVIELIIDFFINCFMPRNNNPRKSAIMVRPTTRTSLT